MNKLTAEQRVQKAHVWLMKNPKYCLYSGVFMLGRVEVVDDVPTACTNGRDVKYGRAFTDKLTDQELRFVILHENLHKAFRHLETWKHLYKKNPRLANIACDYVINLMIHDSDPSYVDVAFPKIGGMLDEKFRGMDAGTVFRMLEQEQEQDGGEGGEGDGGGGFDQHDWDGGEGMTDAEKETLARDIDQALRQGALLAGKMSGNVPREVTEALTPKADWREAMREFINSTCADKEESTWRRPSRRWIGQDVYMPSVIGERVGRVLIAADMSGSMWDMLPRVLGELKAICETVRPEGVDLVYWDTEVCGHEAYDIDQLDNILSVTKPRGGGGTDASCVPRFMADKKLKPECAVILTDGYVGAWGEWPCPTLWGITTNVVSPIGKTIQIS
jgi:predicted metal-dependent peptidase